MFLKMWTTKYTKQDLLRWINEADRIIVGAGSGLSAAAGVAYSGPEFEKEFADFIARYGFTDLYSSSFYPYPTPEEFWACWAKHIDYIRYKQDAKPLYKALRDLLIDKPHFVITTNVDGQFRKAGFNPAKLFEVQGDYAYMQCSKACHDKLYYNENLVKEMVAKTKKCRIPSELVPVCPVCGEPMAVHVRTDEYFIQNEEWDKAYQAYASFLDGSQGKNTLLIELGVGFNTPSIIRFPFDAMAKNNRNFTLVRVNKNDEGAFFENHCAIKVKEDIARLIL